MTEFVFGNDSIDSTIEADEPIVQDTFLPLFDGHNNPNHEIFVIPTQSGSDDEDQWNGSIGDATMEHIYQMRHKMLEMEHFVHMPNGNIFRIEQNVSASDEDNARNIKNQIMKVMTAPTGKQGGRVVTIEDKERVVQFLKDEIEEAKKAREEKEDALDQVLVPFEDWENMPQQTSSIDIPSTAPPLFFYAGNSSQMFYDFVPEDHPDLRKINAFLSTINSIDWDNFSENTVKYFETWIFSKEWTHWYTAYRLIELCQEISSSNDVTPTDLTEKALSDIENDWTQTIRKQVVQKFYEEDPIIQEIKDLELLLQKNRKAGKLSWNEIGKFGQNLYQKYGSNMTTAHWRYYKKVKAKYAPEVRIGNLDINRASLHSLRKLFAKPFADRLTALAVNVTASDEVIEQERKTLHSKIEKPAEWIFHNRPFTTLEDFARKAAFFSVEDVGYTNNTVVFISLLKKAYKECMRVRNTHAISVLSQQIIQMQQSSPNICTEEEWSSIWQTYRVCRTQIQQKFNLPSKV